MRSRSVAAVLLACAALVVTPEAAVAVPQIHAVDLPLPAGATGTVTDLNARGQIAGTVSTGGVSHAVRWDGRTRIDLPLGTNGTNSSAAVINATGTVGGVTWDPNQIGTYITRWLPDGTTQNCGAQAYSVAVVGVNAGNQLLYTYRTPRLAVGSFVCAADGTLADGKAWDAFAFDDEGRIAGGGGVYDPNGTPTFRYIATVTQVGGGATTLPIAADQNALAYDFGPGGEVVGALGTVNFTSTSITFSPQQVVIWRGTQLIQLGTLGGATSAPLTNGRGVNRLGDVVGNSRTTAGDSHAFRWRAGRMTDLGTLGGATSTASAVNDLGVVVGQSTTAAGQTHAFAWFGGHMVDLGAPGGTASTAVAINDRGQVVGTVTRADGAHPVLWTVS